MEVGKKIMGYYNSYDGTQDLTEFDGSLELLVKYSLWQIKNDPEKVKDIVVKAGSQVSGRHLMGALNDDEARPYATEVLKEYEPTINLSELLINSFYSKKHKGPDLRSRAAVEIMKHYGPSIETVKPLVKALKFKNYREQAWEVLKSYVPNEEISNYIVKRLRYKDGRRHIKDLIIEYGASEHIVNALYSSMKIPKIRPHAASLLNDIGLKDVA